MKSATTKIVLSLFLVLITFGINPDEGIRVAHAQTLSLTAQANTFPSDEQLRWSRFYSVIFIQVFYAPSRDASVPLHKTPMVSSHRRKVPFPKSLERETGLEPATFTLAT